jgi:hypothetical protein
MITIDDLNCFFQIVHFLFVKLDGQRSETSFRDCWPIFDKKIEADFRRVCFNWYKELQVSHKNILNFTLVFDFELANSSI